VLAVAIRTVRQNLADYLALHWPSLRELVRGLAMMLALLLGWYLVAYLTGQKPSRYAVDGYRVAQQGGWLTMYLIAACIVAPITEELLVRGFLFRGWSQSFLRPAGAIVLSSAAWSLAHTQYDLFYQAELFSVGLLLGYLRHRSGSTWLTITLHVANNVAAMAWIAAVTR